MNGEALAGLIEAGGAGGLLGALLLGLTMGLTACTVTCLPFMGTWVLGRAGGRGEALRHTGAFILGRVLAYAALGALAGAFGSALNQTLAGNLGQRAIGAASLVAGLWLLLPLLRGGGGAAGQGMEQATAESTVSGSAEGTAGGTAGGTGRQGTGRQGSVQTVTLHPRGSLPGPARGCAARRAAVPPLLLGLALSLTPCAPLGWLLGICALAGSPWSGLGQGLAFGIGAAATPLLLLVPACGSFGRALLEEREWLRFWLRLAAAGVLIFLGSRRLWG